MKRICLCLPADWWTLIMLTWNTRARARVCVCTACCDIANVRPALTHTFSARWILYSSCVASGEDTVLFYMMMWSCENGCISQMYVSSVHERTNERSLYALAFEIQQNNVSIQIVSRVNSFDIPIPHILYTTIICPTNSIVLRKCSHLKCHRNGKSDRFNSPDMSTENFFAV